MRLQLGILLACMSLSVSEAKFVVESDAATAARISSSIDQMLSTLNIGARDSDFAKKAGLAWFFVGPCRGAYSANGELIRPDHATQQQLNGSVAAVVGADITYPYGAALLAVVGLLSRETFLGGPPPPSLCKTVLELAVPSVPVPR